MTQFSFRHPELNNSIKVFEIDHPATQEFTKNRLEKVYLTIPDSLHLVSMTSPKSLQLII
ncbi:class I SAM-dependent methyltransferase [Bacillus sp. T33-2]|uniref:class I SAM-dependent methyltransferase n=1 Tax=Bacillus sp. T33-2 TaxID=2054168 RepID=UPI00215507EF|nr:class I SAM-dependent methyltransferase [Bacillus sp. T33-2]